MLCEKSMEWLQLLESVLTVGLSSAGAAGNFIAPISGLSANAFKTVLDIDTIGSVSLIALSICFVIGHIPHPSCVQKIFQNGFLSSKSPIIILSREKLTLPFFSSTPSKRLFHN
jgi:hypothetical protein